MTYTHLSQLERYSIAHLNSINYSQKDIAVHINRSRATISRELRRNKSQRGYRYGKAQELAELRSRNSRNARTIDESVIEKAKSLIRQDHSPEQVAAQVDMSSTSIYKLIRIDKRAGGTLFKHCRCQKQRRKSYGSALSGRGQIPKRRSIRERPAAIDYREEIGHWEGDTVIGAGNQGAILTLVERKTGFTLMALLPNKTAALVGQACIDLLKPYQPWAKTITFDNGKEFAHHERIDAALGSTTYFADPYSSWQRGTNENTNGLIRQYIPKKRKFETVTNEEIGIIMHKLNTRPRKRLGFNTPIQALCQNLFTVALRS